MILQQYFNKKRTLALGLGMSGLSVGGMSSAGLVNALLERYGLAGALIISAGIWLHTAVASCLYRPVHLNRCMRRKHTSMSSMLNNASDVMVANLECKVEFLGEQSYSDGKTVHEQEIIKEDTGSVDPTKTTYDKGHIISGTKRVRSHDCLESVDEKSRTLEDGQMCETVAFHITENSCFMERIDCATTSTNTEHSDVLVPAPVPTLSLYIDTDVTMYDILAKSEIHHGHNYISTESDTCNNESSCPNNPSSVNSSSADVDKILEQNPCIKYTITGSGPGRHDKHGDVKTHAELITELITTDDTPSNSITSNNRHQTDQHLHQGRPHPSYTSISPATSTNQISTKTSNHGQSVMQTFLIDLFDFHLLKNIPFTLFLMGSFCMHIALMSVYSHFISKMINMGVDRQTAIIVQTVMAGTIIAGRYSVSAIANIKNIDHLVMHGIAVTATSIVVTSLPIAKSLGLLLVYAILHGLSTGR